MRTAMATLVLMLLVACKDGQRENTVSSDTEASVDRASAGSAGSAGSFGKTSAAVGAPVPAIAGSVQTESDFSGRSDSRREVAVAESNDASRHAAPGGLNSPAAAQIASAMVIRNGQASVEVEKLDPAIAKLRQLATQLGGDIANSSMSGGRNQVRSATLELKIPAQRFDQAINGLGGLGKVESVNATAEDVGEEYVDITARVSNAHRLEDRLVNLLATRTGKLQDVLDVERELARVREEIERWEGRLRYLKSRVAVSSLSVTVHEPVPILGQPPGANPIAAALRQAWRNFVGFIAACIASLGVLVPVGALAALGWVVYRRLRSRP